ncbi:MAG TPA: hypothetical protein VIH00_10675 [Candidatus Limnocylindrales bacterium]
MPSDPIRIRPRSAIADPALARAATLDLPEGPRLRFHPPTPKAILETLSTIRQPVEPPERIIVMTLAPVLARRR